jgi:twitching motility protein PilT
MALEIMVATPAIRNLIREEKIHQIYSSLQAGSKYGMQTMNQAMVDLVRRRLITREQALNRSSVPDELAQLLQHDSPASPAATAGRR